MAGCKGAIKHEKFTDLPSYLEPGDTIVVNDTRVSALKLRGKKKTGGNVELLVLSMDGGNAACLLRGKKIRAGTEILLDSGKIKATVSEKRDDGKYSVQFKIAGDEKADENDETERSLDQLLRGISDSPLPPYIKEKLAEPGRYQTVYARLPGSAASPTAGLHFTDALLGSIKDKGVNIAHVTLHIGPGTFATVTDETLKRGTLEREYFTVDADNAAVVNKTIAGGGRLFVVGTSALRALESAAMPDDSSTPAVLPGVSPGETSTELFIYPGYRFRLPIHGLVTNFHLPRSTLLMLVCAYAGRDRIFDAYRTAIEMKYRFYSFGDAMLIFRE